MNSIIHKLKRLFAMDCVKFAWPLVFLLLPFIVLIRNQGKVILWAAVLLSTTYTIGILIGMITKIYKKEDNESKGEQPDYY